MINAETKGNWETKLNGLLAELKLAGATDAIIKPTKVLYQLHLIRGVSRGDSLLAKLPQEVADKVKREMIPYVQKAIKGKKEGWEERAAKYYRRWAYRFIEELLVVVRDRAAWGRVKASTAKRKEGDVGKGVPVDSFGVRHTRPDWRQIQKGKRDAGKRRPGYPVETDKRIVVLINGREID